MNNFRDDRRHYRAAFQTLHHPVLGCEATSLNVFPLMPYCPKLCDRVSFSAPYDPAMAEESEPENGAYVYQQVGGQIDPEVWRGHISEVGPDHVPLHMIDGEIASLPGNR